MKKWIKYIIVAAAALFVVGLIVPERYQMPCGTTDSYNHQSFWWHPWTRGVNGSPHCGVDIFGKEGAEVRPSVGGVVLYSGWFNDVAGNMIVVLGPKWKLHEYMHYTILTPVPHFRLYDKVYGNGRQPEKFNWKKMFYLNPDEYLRSK